MAIDIGKLRSLYKRNPAARKLLDHFADRTNNATETKVDRILHIMKHDGNEISRSEVIDVFRELEDLECGEFVTGRKGWPSRFVWTVGLVGLGKVASGERSELENTTPKTTEEEEAENLRHSFLLRPDLTITFDLPNDFTIREATRLARFVESLPFGDEEQ
jgi:hypothetical protein